MIEKRLKNDSQKSDFFYDFVDSWPIWCQVGPRGCGHAVFWTKRDQTTRNITPEASKKVVWSASLACFTITNFSVAKAIFKKHGSTFQMCFTFYQLTLAQSSPRLGGKTFGGSPLLPAVSKIASAQEQGPKKHFHFFVT